MPDDDYPSLLREVARTAEYAATRRETITRTDRRPGPIRVAGRLRDRARRLRQLAAILERGE